MNLEANVHGKKYTLEAKQLGDNRYRIHLEGENPVEVDVRRVEPDVWSLIIGGKSFEATVQRLDGRLRVSLRGTSWDIDIYDPRQQRSAGGVETVAVGNQVIASPMPGRVVAIAVQPGDAVKAGQGVIIVEAMKMENELTAEGNGTVKEVRVKKGDAVEDGQPLVIIGITSRAPQTSHKK